MTVEAGPRSREIFQRPVIWAEARGVIPNRKTRRAETAAIQG
jgi:hypothetical protein